MKKILLRIKEAENTTKIFLQWLSLSVAFFIYNYIFTMFKSGRLALSFCAAFLVGAAVTAMARLLHLVCHRAFSGGAATFFAQAEYIITFMWAFIAACGLVFIFPDWLPDKDTSKAAMLLFFVVYSFAAVWSTGKLSEEKTGSFKDRP